MSLVRKLALVSVLGSPLLGLAACGDSSGPASGVTVDVVLQKVLGPTVYRDALGESTVFCSVDLQAVARGTGSARWLDATLRWYAGAEGVTAIDSSVMPFDEIQGSWGQAEIAAGERLDTRWEFTAYAPFGASIEFRYRPAEGGGTRSTTVRFACSPPIPDNVAPPAISALTVLPPAGDFEPGDVLMVSYSASSAATLWRSYVQLSGPCFVEVSVAENLEAAVNRTVSIPIPAECRLGVPLTVTVITFDAASQRTTRQATTPLTLVDRTPPWIQPRFFPSYSSFGNLAASGDYFAGDSIEVILSAGDNHGLSALVWEVLPYGIRDSTIVTTPTAAPRIFIRLRPEWSGPIELRLYARDQVGLVSNIVMSAPDSVRVRPLVQRATTKATVSGEIRDLVIDSRRGVIYLLQTSSRRIAVLQLSTMQVSSTIAMPSFPQGLDLSVGGDSLIVTLAQGALGIIDLRQSTLAATIVPLADLDQSLGQQPARVRVAANGKAMVALQGASEPAYRLLEVDLRTGAQRRRADVAGGGTMNGSFERSHDRSIMTFVNFGSPACFQTYDSNSDAFGTCSSSRISDGWQPTVDATGQRTAVNLEVFDASLRLLRRAGAPFGTGIVPTALSPDGEYLYEAIPRLGIVRARVSDGQMLDRTYTPLRIDLLRVSADGALLVAVESPRTGTSEISTIDLR